jgi:hypothetical protein
MNVLRKAVLVPLGAVLALAAASTAAAQPTEAVSMATASVRAVAQAEDDDAPVLPSRVANAIKRAQTALDNTAEHIDEGEYKQVTVSLRALRRNMYRAHTAAVEAMNAVPVDPEAEPEEPQDPNEPPDAPEAPEAPDAPEGVTTGPDSVVAVLTLDQEIVTSLAGLFDMNSQGVVSGLSRALFQTMNARDKLLASVIALPAEGAGADYADVMADTAAGYDDEVANLTEALKNDKLSVGGGKVLTQALVKSKATQTMFATAFGGGE